MTAFYNEHDPFAAAWLRELIKDGLIAPGVVDERSIEDITPDELRPFQQCHFFAGIGVWSLAARRAGIADDAPLWSGSCPCQPFSAAGQGGGFADERHLWPAFHYLIEQCRPPLVVGEQVAGADGDTWFDLVSADLDATGYAFGVAETVAAGFGAPHKRTRNYWLAYDTRSRWGKERPNAGGLLVGDSAQGWGAGLGDGRGTLGVDNPAGPRHEPAGSREQEQSESGRSLSCLGCEGGGMADTDGPSIGRGEQRQLTGNSGAMRRANSGPQSRSSRRLERPGPVNGLWGDADWLRCRDERWRAVEPGTFPLADAGTFRNRVGLLRGAGNAVTLGQAQGFLEAVIASLPHENGGRGMDTPTAAVSGADAGTVGAITCVASHRNGA